MSEVAARTQKPPGGSGWDQVAAHSLAPPWQSHSRPERLAGQALLGWAARGWSGMQSGL